MKKTTILFTLLAFTALTCRKEDDDFGLPPATQTGANTFGCLVDGKPWIAEIDPKVLDPLIRKTSSRYDEVGIGAADNFYFH